MRTDDRTGVAIVGMAATFPGAPDLARFGHNLAHGIDAIGDVPADRWDARFYDPSSTAADRFYCKRGGFLDGDVPFDALAHGIMPVAAAGAEPDQLLALDCAASAMKDAGYEARDFDRERAAVILGRGAYMTAGLARLADRVRSAEQLTRNLETLVPGLDATQLAAVKAEFLERLGPFGGDTAIGLVPNLAASRIANRLDLHGPAYTLDAACASSLVAVDHACRELLSGASDLVIAGGVHVCHDPTIWSVFCQLGALSRKQRIAPFDRDADGLLIGEGVGIVVLKRLADAERDGDRVYAVVRGTGVSSDGRAVSLMTPAVEGQVRALTRAWKASGLDPATVGLVEAHGTATPAGDAAELATLAQVFGAPATGEARAALGSVKSMIGHAMPAAGVAGLIKAALAIHEGLLPPTLHCETPRAELEQTRFRTLGAAEPWETRGLPRRAGVNAFGFGGINAHVVLESAPSATTSRGARTTLTSPVSIAGATATRAPLEPLLLVAAATPEGLAARLDAHAVGTPSNESIGDGPCRIAIFDPTPERLARAKKIVARGEAWRGRDDLWFAPRGLLDDGGRIAFVFPGVDQSFQPRVDDVLDAFSLPFQVPARTDDLKELGLGIVAVNRASFAALDAIGARPDVIAGHSIGEWSAMIAAEMIPAAHVDPLIARLTPERVDVPGVVFVAAGAGVAKVLPTIAGLGSIAVSHDNCPHQVILCGREAEADVAIGRMKSAGILCQKLDFRSGYHSPLFADFVGPHRRVLSELALQPPRVPMWSATTCAPYPDDPAAVRHLAVQHLVEPVRFREVTETLHDHGVRVFVQCGTGSLVGFMGDTLRGKPHLGIAANVPNRSGLAQLRRVAAALFVEGDARPLAALDARLADRTAPPAVAKTTRPIRIALGAPLTQVSTPLPSVGATAPSPLADLAGHPLAAELALALGELQGARDEVLSAFARAPLASPDAPATATFRPRISVEEYPELFDHTFYRQPPGWTVVEDRYPVVPMTMLMSLMMEAAQELVPHKVPVALSGVRAARWLAVAPAVELAIEARYDGVSKVEVAIFGYATGFVEMADRFPDAPAPSVEPLAGASRVPMTAEKLYADRWMFHGPEYQGVVGLDAMSKAGIEGTLVGLAARGGLLDNAGQLLGYWAMCHATVDRLAMPVSIQDVRVFGPEPPPGARVACKVWVRDFNETHLRADVELVHDGTLWCRIEGWIDHRFDCDERVWGVLTFPEKNTITVVDRNGHGTLEKPWRASASRDLLARRYLTLGERAAMRDAGPKRAADFLMERMAIKDAVRQHLWDRGHATIFPIEIEVEETVPGRFTASGPFVTDLRVSAVSASELAIASVVDGRPTGTWIEPSSDDAATARLVAAKRAAARARGVEEWRACEARSVRGERIEVLVEGEAVWVETREVKGRMAGWTV